MAGLGGRPYILILVFTNRLALQSGPDLNLAATSIWTMKDLLAA